MSTHQAMINGPISWLCICSLPKLIISVNELLTECQRDLEALPTRIAGDASTEVLLRTTRFCDDFRAATFGENCKYVAQANRERYAQFREDIHCTRPDFRPWNTDQVMKHPSHYLLGGDAGELSGPPITSTEVQRVIQRYGYSVSKSYRDVNGSIQVPLDGNCHSMCLLKRRKG